MLSMWCALAWSIPAVTGPVSDHVDVLDPSEEARISEALVGIRERTGVHIAVLTTSSVPYDTSLERFSMDIATAWGGGSGSRDDGLLVLLAVSDRRSRIEVGYGLEGYVTDAEAGALLSEATPALRDGRYVDALLGIVDGLGAEVASLTPEASVPVWRQAVGGVGRAIPDGGGLITLGAMLGALLGVPMWMSVYRGAPISISQRLVPSKAGLAVAAVGLVVVGPILFLDGLASIWSLGGGLFWGAVCCGPLGAAENVRKLALGAVALVAAIGVALLFGAWIPSEVPQAWMGAGAMGLPLIAFLSLDGGFGSSSGGGGGSSSSGRRDPVRHPPPTSNSSSAGSGGSSGGDDWSGGGGGFGGGGASGSW